MHLIDTPAYKQNLTYDAMGNLIESEVQDGIGSYKANYLTMTDFINLPVK